MCCHSGFIQRSRTDMLFLQASVAFMSVVREVLQECGVTEAATFDSMSAELVARVRFIIIEVNTSREAYLEADKKNHYAIIARTLDKLYQTVEDVTISSEYRKVAVTKLVNFRRSISDVFLDRYDMNRVPH